MSIPGKFPGFIDLFPEDYQYRRSDHTYFLFIIIVLLAVYYTGLIACIRGDAVRYAAIAREMTRSHHFIDLQNRGGVPYMQKPPLFMWISYLSFSIFGISNISYKLPVLLISLAGVFFTYRYSRLFYSKQISRLACMFILTSFGFIFYHNDVHTDTVLMTAVIFSTWQLSLFTRKKKFINLFWGFTGIGLGMMTKGPVGMVIPVFAIGTHLLLKRSWRMIFRWEYLAGLLIVIIVISPALLGLYRQFGTDGLIFYFWSNNAGRISGTLHSNSNDYFYYLHTLLWLFIPWSLFVVFGLFREIVSLSSKKFRLSDQEEGINIGGIFLFFLIISISKFKSPNYLIPIFPFFAIISAKWLINSIQSYSKRFHRIFTGLNYTLVFLLWMGILIVGGLNFGDIPKWIKLIVVILLMMTLIMLFSQETGYTKFVKTALLMVLALGIFFNSFICPLSYTYHAMYQASLLVNKHYTENERFIMFEPGKENFSDDTFNFYLVPEPEFTDEIKFVLSMEDGWVFTRETGLQRLKENGILYDEITRIPHLYFMNVKFLIPGSRESVLSDYYLLRINRTGVD